MICCGCGRSSITPSSSAATSAHPCNFINPSVLQSLEDLRLVDQPGSGSGAMRQAGPPGWGPSSAALPSSSQWVSQPAQPQGAGWPQGVQGGWQAGPGRAPGSAGMYGPPGRTQQR